MGKIIYRIQKLITVLCVSVVLFSLMHVNANIEAVTSESELFEQAYRHYLSYEPAKALELLDLFLREYPKSSAKDAILFWKGKSLVQLGKPADARKTFSQLINNFPESYFKGLAEKEIANIQERRVPGAIRTEQQHGAPPAAGNAGEATEQEKLEAFRKNENLQLELAELKRKYETAEKTLSEQRNASAEITVLKQKYDEAVRNIKTLEQKKTELSAMLEQVTDKENDWKQLDSYIQELEKEKKNLEQQVRTRDQKLADYQKSVAGLEKQIKELESKRAGGERDLSDRIAQLTQEKEALELIARNTEQKEKDVVRLEAELKQLEHSRKALEQKVQQRDQELIDYRGSIAGLERKIMEIETDRDRRNRDMSREIARLSEEKAELEKKIKTRTGRVRVPESEKNERNRLEAELKELKQARDEAQRQADGDIRRLEMELSELRRKHAAFKAMAGDTEQKNNDIILLEKKLKQLEQSRQGLEKEVKERDQKLLDYRKSVADLEEKISKIEAGGIRRNSEAGAQIKHLTEEKGLLEKRLRKEQTHVAQLKQKMTEKERMAQQMDLGANMDVVRLRADLDKKEREYEENRVLAIKLQKENKDLKALLEKQKSRRVNKDDTDEIQRLETELKQMEQSKQELQARKDKEIRQLNVKLHEQKSAYEQNKEALTQLQKEKKDLATRLQERESSMTVVRDDIAERKRLETELKQRERSLKELREQNDRTAKQLGNDLRKQKEQAEEYARSLERLKGQERQLTKKYNDLSRMHNEQKKELDTLRNTVKQYEEPVVIIDKARYSVLDILNYYTQSSAVLAKIGNPVIFWKSDNLYEDFITEQILLGKADAEGIQVNESTVRSLSRDHELNKNEQVYLSQFLKIEKFISDHMSGDVVDDRTVREYYDAYRDNYISMPGVKTFSFLRLRYSEEDEIDKALLATSLRERVENGEPLRDIYRSMPDLLALETVTSRNVPEWVSKKIGSLKKGMISDVIIFDNALHIFHVLTEKAPVYKDYESVKDDIRKDLLLQQRIDSLPVTEWLRGIRSEAVQIK